ncbi:hypothetical protein VIGAN_06199000 [Vigna angularis var. angularis]|uniref:Uncharacterized protein n=1 Tax=Vigna angularis var. angularis TaxID=157739 RepID=A0A0S3SD07_PHAAN|nr:hypothetical protein VIGAN_06199000 [Vigna angularis var. angularis]
MESPFPWWASTCAREAGGAPPAPLHWRRPPQSPLAQEKAVPEWVQPVRAQTRPDQWTSGTGMDRWVRVWRVKPPPARTGWPALG